MRLGFRGSVFTPYMIAVAVVVVAGCGGNTPSNQVQLPREVKACAGPSILNGVDVSYYQGDSIDWVKAAADGTIFAFIRVSDGINTPDTCFTVNWAGAKKAGIIRGAYQFFRPSQDAVAQARLLLEKMGSMEDGDLPPVIDVEQTGGLTGPEIAVKVGEWVGEIEGTLGVKPIIYTGKYFWEDNVGSSAFVNYPLWLPYYTVECPNTPAPWKTWKFWQWTSTGAVDGIPGNADQDIFNGTLEELKAMTYSSVDGGAADGGVVDGGQIDGGEVDGGSTDAGQVDGGSETDSGTVADAGEGDAFTSPDNDLPDASSLDAGFSPDVSFVTDAGAEVEIAEDGSSDSGAFVASPDTVGCSCSTVGLE